jgi:hypothetical protein
MRISAAILLFVSMSVVSLAAQSGPRYEAAVAYQFMHDQDIAERDPDLSANFSAGWMASGGVNLWGSLGAVGEVSGSSKTLDIPGDKPKLRVYTFMAGPRFRRPVHAGITPFAQVLLGSARASTSLLGIHDTVTDFSYQPGGGIDLNSTRRLGVRFEGDYRIIRAEHRNNKEPRFVAAAVIGF